MSETKTKTQTVTNTQLAVAVVAAFLAGGLAFAAAPAANQGAGAVAGACVLSEATMVYTHAINKTRQLCPNNGYWGARFTCTDRKADTVDVGVGNPCVTQDAILAMARAKCAGLTHSCVPRNVNPPAAVVPRLNFSLQTNEPGIRYEKFILGGQGAVLGKIVMTNTSTNAMQVNTLTLTALPDFNRASWTSWPTSVSDLMERIDSVALYAGPQAMEIIAQGRVAQDGTITFQNINRQVPANSTASMYVGVSRATAYQGIRYTAVPSFSIGFSQDQNLYQIRDLVTAQNVSPYLPPYTNTSTLETEIVPFKIVSIRSNPLPGPLVGGQQNILSFSITGEAGQNVNEFGDSVQARIVHLPITLTTDLVGLVRAGSSTPFELCRMDTASCIPVRATGQRPLDQGTNFELYLGTTGSPYIEFSAFADSDDAMIRSGQTVQFVLKGTFPIEPDKFLQAKLDRIWTQGLRYQFDIKGDEAPEGIIYNLRQDEPREQNWPDVLGTALNS